MLDSQKITEVVQSVDKTTVVVTSSRAGLGKTQYIKRVAKQERLNLIVFPIAGEISYE